MSLSEFRMGLHDAGIVPYTMKCVCALVTGVEKATYLILSAWGTLCTRACK